MHAAHRTNEGGEGGITTDPMFNTLVIDILFADWKMQDNLVLFLNAPRTSISRQWLALIRPLTGWVSFAQLHLASLKRAAVDPSRGTIDLQPTRSSCSIC